MENQSVVTLKAEPEVNIYAEFSKLMDAQIIENMNIHRCPGMAVLILKDNQVIFEKEYGTKSVHSNEPIDRESIFRLGSVSKGFAGILSAILINKNMIHLDDPLFMYIPELTLKAKTQDKILRVKHILTHSSGLTEHAFSNLVDENQSMETIINNLNHITPRDSTDKSYAYQNATFGLIERVIERVTGMTYAEALDFYLFSPLEMCKISCSYQAICQAENVCAGHKYGSSKTGFKQISFSPHYYNVVSAGGINASLGDMQKWLSAVMGYLPDVIPAKALSIAFHPYISTKNDDKYFNNWPGVQESGYGLGWRLIETHTNHLIYHGGLVNGFRTEIAFDPEKKLGIVLLFNSTCAYSNQAVPLFFQLWEDYSHPCNENYL
ncbi:MAG: beta-lactamase family protein [Saprospiraceae bacterium]|nr:beta-lactamase family protein [Saprospiraceae bacterium]